MTNAEKYKSAEERGRAFREFCHHGCAGCGLSRVSFKLSDCPMLWLELTAEEEKPLPCPLRGGEVVVGYTTNIHKEDFRQVWCKDMERCGYYCEKRKSADEAIAVHNRYAKAAMDAKNEVKNG